MTMQEAVNHPFITKQGQLPPVDICVSSGTEEKQPGGWASNDISWNARIRAIRAVRTARTSIEEEVSMIIRN